MPLLNAKWGKCFLSQDLPPLSLNITDKITDSVEIICQNIILQDHLTGFC